MLTPEDIERFKCKFESIHELLDLALSRKDDEITDDALGYYIEALRLMEELTEEVGHRQGYSIRDALKRVATTAKTAEGAGAAGAVGGAATALSFTGLGGFGLAAGGTAVGVSGLAGATVATGGAGLAGAAALYLAYKGGAAALETELGKKATNEIGTAGKRTVSQVRDVGKTTVDRLKKMRHLKVRLENPEDDSSPS